MSNRVKILLGLGLPIALISFFALFLAPKKPVIISAQTMGAASSTVSTTLREPVVRFLKESNKISQRKVYWDKNNQGRYSNAENLPQRADGVTPIAFYAEPIVYKEAGKLYDIEVATATLSDFEEMTRVTLLDKLRKVFIGTAFATATFNATSTYTPDETGTVQYLIVGAGGGGGGGGGPNFNAGGGGGEVVTSSSYAVTASQGYAVGVGSGGIGNDNNDGLPGGTSTFDGIPAQGGRGGGSTSTVETGSGGNSGRDLFGGGDAISSQAGGGGGASQRGFNGSGGNDSEGGVGVTSTISGTAICYGGGGAGNNDSIAVVGKCGGGSEDLAGTANRGGGGGGGAGGQAGGSGVVIVAFNSSSPATAVIRRPMINLE